MESKLLEKLRNSANKMGKCDPLWLKKDITPKINFQEGESGNGPKILLLHGLFGAVSNWDSVFPLFEKFSHPIALMFPIKEGHKSEVKIKALAVLVEYFIRLHNHGPITVCGNSLGGHVALRLALSSPELVDKLILSGASGLYEHTADTLPVRPGKEFVREHMQRVFYNQDFITEDAVEDIANVLRKKGNVLNLVNAAKSAKRDNLFERLPEVKAKTLLLWGENDGITDMDVAQTFADRIPNSELKTINRCGHAPMIEHPQWFAERVKEFIAS